jgi:hypothetical protein
MAPDAAARALAKEVEKMEKRGYQLVVSNIAEAGRSKRSWVMLGAVNLLRGKQVQATATFRRVV